MIGKTNAGSGGGGSGGTLTVTAPAGVTVTISKDGKEKRKKVGSDGLATFKGLKTGTWTVVISDETQTSPARNVAVVADYEVTMAFFAASIATTFPEGSTCVCSDGITTITAPNTTGSYTFTVPNTGTWTLTCTDGTDTATDTVEITADGQSESVELTYFDGYLFNYGSVNENITGGWKKDGGGTITTKADGSIVAKPTEEYAAAIYHTKNKIDLTKFSTITMNGIMWETNGWYRTHICVWSAVTYGKYTSGLVASVKGDSNSAKDYTLDVSGLSGSYYIGIEAHDHPNYAKLTMNTMKLT